MPLLFTNTFNDYISCLYVTCAGMVNKGLIHNEELVPPGLRPENNKSKHVLNTSLAGSRKCRTFSYLI